MVTSAHEAMHRIFQEDPGIVARAFRPLGVPFPEPVAATVLTPDVTENRPLERRIDTLLLLETSTEGPEGKLLLAVESQGRRDPAKPSSWAYYSAYLRAKYGLDVVLLVVCQDRATARWAEGPFCLGAAHWPLLTLRPLVLGPHNVPLLTDPEAIARDIPLATFSAITHRGGPCPDEILKMLFSAHMTLDEETSHLFVEITERGLGDTPAADIWRDLMALDLDFFTSDTSMRLREEGRALGLAEAVLGVLAVRGVEVSAQARERVRSCEDLDVLRHWLEQVIEVSSVEELLTEPAGSARAEGAVEPDQAGRNGTSGGGAEVPGPRSGGAAEVPR